MKISHGTRIADQSEQNGYGYATKNMLDSLHRLGYEVKQNDRSADVEIWFDQPHHWSFTKGLYRIGYHPWESTHLKPGWAEVMNECDEIWTPSPLIAQWYTEHAGITRPVYVYEHGVDPIWTPKERVVDGTFKFLHVGGEAVRKGGTGTMKAMRKAFPNNEDVSLTMKVISDGWKVPRIGRTHVINDHYRLEQLIQLFHDHHAYVYPSFGEGFGLTPLQALATGMPTITLPAWAPYAQFLDPNLSVRSTMGRSPWPVIHPGQVFIPSEDSVIESMRYVYHNYDEAQQFAHAQLDALLSYYDWDRLTKEVFSNLEARLETS